MFNHKLTLVQLYIIIGMCALPVFYIVGAGAVLFWVLGMIICIHLYALSIQVLSYLKFYCISGTSWFIVLLHAAFYNIDAALNSDENELDALIMEEV